MSNVLTVAEVARQCGVTPKTVVRWIRYGTRGKKLQAEQYGHYRIRQHALESFRSMLAPGERYRQDREDALAELRGEA